MTRLNLPWSDNCECGVSAVLREAGIVDDASGVVWIERGKVSPGRGRQMVELLGHDSLVCQQRSAHSRQPDSKIDRIVKTLRSAWPVLTRARKYGRIET